MFYYTTSIDAEMICMKACCTYRSCMKITLSHKEQQIFLAQCFWEGIIDFECLINVFMLYHIQTSLGSSVKSPITQKNSRDRSVFAQTI